MRFHAVAPGGEGGAVKRYLEILRLVWPLALGMVNNAVMQFVDGARATISTASMSSFLTHGLSMI